MATVTRTTTTITRTNTRLPTYRPGPARGWLMTLGWTLIGLGILGFINAIVDVAHDFAFHFEGGQAIVHWVLGIACLVVAYAVRARIWLGASSITAGAFLIAAGLLGFIESTVGAWHAGTGDNVLHLLLGLTSVLVGIVSINREREQTDRPAAVVPPA